MNKYLTEDIPGVGGFFKESPDTFFVEEVPLYTPLGEGEHLYLWVEKRGITTHELVTRISRVCKIKDREISYAGLKDARAVTRQYISVPARMVPDPDNLQIEGATILSASRHKNKLRMGHLAGNRFVIQLQGIEPHSHDRIESILSRIRAIGMPNLFGEQRYGVFGNSHLIGKALLLGDFAEAISQLMGDPETIKNATWRQATEAFREGNYSTAGTLMPRRNRVECQLLKKLAAGVSAKEALATVPEKLIRLYLNAYQSSLFDQLALGRISQPDRLQEGDIACKHVNGAVFKVENLEVEQLRSDQQEISATAPMFGEKTLFAEGVPGDKERHLLDSEGLQLSKFSLSKRLHLSGERRPIRVPVVDLAASYSDETPDTVTLTFQLPKGSYATSLLREVIKDM